MDNYSKGAKLDTPFILGITFLIAFSILILYSLAKILFPLYFLYIFLGIVAFIFFAKLDFEIISFFSKHLYIFSIIFLILPLFIGQVSRGAVRWIPIGALTIQPAEIVRPFLVIFFANYLTQETLTYPRLVKSLILLLIPSFLILIQPSLGMAVLTIISFLGVFITVGLNKKRLLISALLFILAIPLIFQLLAPYQKARIKAYLNPSSDPLGTGYNSIQSMISVGSGKIIGRGLGKGVQTQLKFLPEKHTDFVFASIAEELGFIGSFLVLLGIFLILWRLTVFIEKPVNTAAKAYIAGVFITLLFQTVINIGMNLGIVPVTGLPLPLVSAGGSSLLATLISLGMAMGAANLNQT